LIEPLFSLIKGFFYLSLTHVSKTQIRGLKRPKKTEKDHPCPTHQPPHKRKTHFKASNLQENKKRIQVPHPTPNNRNLPPQN
jgi:hypothetical protein